MNTLSRKGHIHENLSLNMYLHYCNFFVLHLRGIYNLSLQTLKLENKCNHMFYYLILIYAQLYIKIILTDRYGALC